MCCISNKHVNGNVTYLLFYFLLFNETRPLNTAFKIILLT